MSETLSSVYAATAPSLLGVWVFDPTDPDGTAFNFPYASGRSLRIQPKADSIELAGQVDPLIEYGTSETVGLKLTVLVPFSEDGTNAAHDAGVNWWLDACTNRRTINYRDNRGRLVWVGLPDGVEVTDGRAGSAFQLALQRVNYDESVD